MAYLFSFSMALSLSFSVCVCVRTCVFVYVSLGTHAHTHAYTCTQSSNVWQQQTDRHSHTHQDRRSMILLRKTHNELNFEMWCVTLIWIGFLISFHLSYTIFWSPLTVLIFVNARTGCRTLSLDQSIVLSTPRSLCVCVYMAYAGVLFIAEQTVFNLVRRCVKHHPFVFVLCVFFFSRAVASITHHTHTISKTDGRTEDPKLICSICLFDCRPSLEK